MNCMKCGKETAQSQVFCDSCLEVMARYPVAPDTAFQLPQRKPLSADKKVSRTNKELSLKEALRRQRKLIKWQRIALLVAAALLALLLTVLIFVLYTQTDFFAFIPFLP